MKRLHGFLVLGAALSGVLLLLLQSYESAEHEAGPSNGPGAPGRQIPSGVSSSAGDVERSESEAAPALTGARESSGRAATRAPAGNGAPAGDRLSDEDRLRELLRDDSTKASEALAAELRSAASKREAYLVLTRMNQLAVKDAWPGLLGIATARNPSIDVRIAAVGILAQPRYRRYRTRIQRAIADHRDPVLEGAWRDVLALAEAASKVGERPVTPYAILPTWEGLLDELRKDPSPQDAERLIWDIASAKGGVEGLIAILDDPVLRSEHGAETMEILSGNRFYSYWREVRDFLAMNDPALLEEWLRMLNRK